MSQPLEATEKCMRISDDRKRRIVSDLGLNFQYIKGQDIPVKDCWHFYTDGSAVDSLFYDDDDFRDGMNRIYKLSLVFETDILAFSLMDTHVHIALHGEFDECSRFMHEFIRLTSYHISTRYGERNKLADLQIQYQMITTSRYLKTVICYIIKNAPVGGLPFTAYDYPWSSGPLMFRRNGYWTSPIWMNDPQTPSDTLLSVMSGKKKKNLLKAKYISDGDARIMDGIVFPGEYVAYEIVEMLFRTHRSFNYFMCISKDSDIESMEGFVSSLSIPIQEMRQHKSELCMQMFGKRDIRSLDINQRLCLARTLKSRYNSSMKQICRLCGLNYDEVRGII